jgi:hypothetical protein
MNFAQQEQKGFLSQIFCFGRVSYHAQAYRIHASAMQPVEVFEHRPITVLGSLNDLPFAQLIAGARKDWRRSLLRDAFLAGTRIPI